MSDKRISQMPFVSSEDVKPLYTGDEIIEKLAIAVNGMRTMKEAYNGAINTSQHFDLELMYSLAIYLRDKK